jgi:hypothetical protein
LLKARLTRAQKAITHAGLGGVLCFNFDNIRYVTAKHIGEWARDKFFRYAMCPREGSPFLWDPAPPAKRLSSPWIADNVAAPITAMQGAIPPNMNVQRDFAKQIKKALVQYGIAKEPLGIDIMELGMIRALEEEGIEIVDGQQALLDARPKTRSNFSNWPQRWSTRPMSTSREQFARVPKKTSWSPLQTTDCFGWDRNASSVSTLFRADEDDRTLTLLPIE